jgi:alpha-glucosidase
VVAFTAINGSKQEISPEAGEITFEGDLRPNGKLLYNLKTLPPSPISVNSFTFGKFSGEWMLVDKCVGLSLVNRFSPREVSKCFVHWGTGDVNMELWSEERPVSNETPLRICHQYVVRQTS